jgi:hypothetical protein
VSERFEDEDLCAALDALAGAWRVDNIVIWAVRGQRIVALRTRDSSGEELSIGEQAWRQRGADLRRGRTTLLRGAEFHPLRGNDGALCGFVQVREPGPLSAARRALAEAGLTQLARLLDGSNAERVLFPDVTDPLKRTRLLEERAELISKLNRRDWIFSRLARDEGITRQTVRNRVKRLRIQIPEWARQGRRRSPA